MKIKMKYVTLICIILVLISFWLPWVNASEMLSSFSNDEKISISAYGLIEFTKNIDTLISTFSGESLWQLKVVNLYFLIPIVCILSIFLMLLKKHKSFKIFSIVGFCLVIIMCLAPLIVINTNSNFEMLMEVISGVGFGYGYILTLIASVVGLIYSFMIPINEIALDSEESI